jgi:hypothetical protein
MGVHVTGAPPTQTPDWQVSTCVQALLSLQVAPFGWLDQSVVLVAGLQTWQVLEGFATPAGYRVPEMTQLLGGTAQTFGLPPAPHMSGKLQEPQVSVPPQPSGAVPQLSPAGQEVMGVQLCANADGQSHRMQRSAAEANALRGNLVEIMTRPFSLFVCQIHSEVWIASQLTEPVGEPAPQGGVKDGDELLAHLIL